MRIISKFHDYYDSVQGYGTDDILYIRKTEYIKDVKLYEHFKDILKCVVVINASREYNSYDINVPEIGLIVFCAKIYPYMICHINENKKHVVYSTDEFYKLIDPKDKKALKHFEDKNYWRDNTRRWLDEFFSYSGKDYKECMELHFKYKTPIIRVSNQLTNKHTTKKDPALKNLKFFKVLDTYTCFQELSMFVGGVMGGKCPPMVEISDEVRLAKHGFNKWSFRKQKGD